MSGRERGQEEAQARSHFFPTLAIEGKKSESHLAAAAGRVNKKKRNRNTTRARPQRLQLSSSHFGSRSHCYYIY